MIKNQIIICIGLQFFISLFFINGEQTSKNEYKLAYEYFYNISKIELTGKNQVIKESDEKVDLNSASSQETDNESKITSATSSNGYLGKFRITRYCPCEICNGKWAANNKIDENGNIIAYGASGKILNSGYSCAADTSLPFGTKLYIPQIGLTVTVDDRAAKSIEKKYDGKFVDLYFSDHGHYIEGASDYMEVYIVE